jgi:hypothetical protein
MDIVMIKCPNTGRAMSADMKIERSSFESRLDMLSEVFTGAGRTPRRVRSEGPCSSQGSVMLAGLCRPAFLWTFSKTLNPY